MEGKLIRKYREIFSRIPANSNTIKDIMFLMDQSISEDDNIIMFPPYRNILEKTKCEDWLRSRGVRHADITITENQIFGNVEFCSYLRHIIEFVSFLRANNIGKDLFHKSIYSTENSRDTYLEKKYHYR